MAGRVHSLLAHVRRVSKKESPCTRHKSCWALLGKFKRRKFKNMPLYLTVSASSGELPVQSSTFACSYEEHKAKLERNIITYCDSSVYVIIALIAQLGERKTEDLEAPCSILGGYCERSYDISRRTIRRTRANLRLLIIPPPY